MVAKKDPESGLLSKDIATRAATARDLGRTGTWADIPLLLQMTIQDKSSSVRLHVAGAISNILSRQRGALGQSRLSAKKGKALEEWMRRIDPGLNVSVPLILSAVASKSAMEKLGRMLRDPRAGVRQGSAIALRRMVFSGGFEKHKGACALACTWLVGRKYPTDAKIELAALIGEVGWHDAAGALETLSSSSEGLLLETLREARGRLDGRRDLAQWTGLWVDDGLDVYEVSDQPRERRWMIVVDERVIFSDGKTGSLTLLQGRAEIDGVDFGLLWLPTPGKTPSYRAIQGAGATWSLQEGKDYTREVQVIFKENPALEAQVSEALNALFVPVKEAPKAGKSAVAASKPNKADAANDKLIAGKEKETP